MIGLATLETLYASPLLYHILGSLLKPPCSLLFSEICYSLQSRLLKYNILLEASLTGA
jgi:hypothetical protein